METMIHESALAVIGVISLLGLGILSPPCRAWVHVLLGNYTTAAEIYERRLTRHPQRLHLYLKLAALYMLAGRCDEHALTAYRIIRQISHAIQKSAEINPVASRNAHRWICSTPVAI
jgi:hypothetical protein